MQRGGPNLINNKNYYINQDLDNYTEKKMLEELLLWDTKFFSQK